MYECLILNGLSERGFDDSCTFVSNSGSSVVDYFLLSCDMLSSVCITSLEVENMIESDHLPVVVAINVSQLQLRLIRVTPFKRIGRPDSLRK